MKLTSTLLKKVCLLFGIGMFFFFACDTSSTNDSDQSGTYGDVLEDVASSTPPCNCDSSWFPHSQTPPPEQGAGSPFDTSSTTNCIFHQWSWQKFLYLTKNENGRPLFFSHTISVDPAMGPVPSQLGLDLVLSSTGQAGGGGVLRSNPDFNTDNIMDTVYYSIHVDSTMYNASQDFVAGLKDGSIPPNNSETFPVNSYELKIAWVDISAMPASDTSSYYTTLAAVQQADGSYKKTTVALLGMHVVGVVINHPEFIWATFEHNSMAPSYDWKTATVNSSTDQLIYGAGSTTGLGGIQWTGTEVVTPNKAYTLFEFGIPRMPSDTFMLTSQSEPENYNNIVNIDSCVAANLGNDVWNNYFYKGSLWINTDGLSPTEQADTIVALAGNLYDVSPGRIPRGCVSASNLVMETFEQTFASKIGDVNTVTNISNCFACHNSVSHTDGSPKSPIYISHIFDGLLSASQGNSLTDIEEKKLRQYKRMIRTIRAK